MPRSAWVPSEISGIAVSAANAPETRTGFCEVAGKALGAD